ncbi:MAG: hypothetical protein KKA07_01770 [Bacteroidetes bacterium]|nr:hypothetical protein [Bacteroidota bacterium]MBU1717778.1 hypothetical protein [Bacteroidota bacterium]
MSYTDNLIGSNQESNPAVRMRVANSSLIYMASFIILNFAQDFISSVSAALFNLKPVLFYHKLTLQETDHGHLKTIVFSFLSGPFAILVIGFIALQVFFYARKFHGTAKFFLLWLGVAGFTIFLTQVITAQVFPDRSICMAYRLIDISDTTAILFSILASIAFVFFSTRMPKFFLRTTTTTYYLKHEHQRRRYLFQTAFLPWMLGSIGLAVFYLPEFTMHFFYQLMAFGICTYIAWEFSRSRKNKQIKLFKHPPIKKLAYVYLIVILLLYLNFHLTLAKGIAL